MGVKYSNAVTAQCCGLGTGTKIFIYNSVYELYNCLMEVVSDASVFLTVALNEMDREWVIEKTSGYSIVSPKSCLMKSGMH